MQAGQAITGAYDADYAFVILSDRHRGVFNAASSRQRRVVDVLGPKLGGDIKIACDTLIHNGDTHDMERCALHDDWFVQEEDKSYYDSVNAAKARGVRQVMLRGNHDEPLRALAGQTRLGIEYAEKMEFETAKGQKVLVLHGDQFDPELSHLTNLARGNWRHTIALADHLNTALIAGSTWASRALHRAVGADFHLYGAVTTALNTMTGYKQDFEARAVNHALDHGKDIIITGHTHIPYIKTIRKGDLVSPFNKASGVKARIAERDVVFMNVGDGTESFSFGAITKAGDPVLRYWPDFIRQVGPEPEGLRARNKEAHRAETQAQLDDTHNACFGVTADNGVPRSFFMPDIRPASPSIAGSSR